MLQFKEGETAAMPPATTAGVQVCWNITGSRARRAVVPWQSGELAVAVATGHFSPEHAFLPVFQHGLATQILFEVFLSPRACHRRKNVPSFACFHPHVSHSRAPDYVCLQDLDMSRLI
jgi:hypothetical protein